MKIKTRFWSALSSEVRGIWIYARAVAELAKNHFVGLEFLFNRMGICKILLPLSIWGGGGVGKTINSNLRVA